MNSREIRFVTQAIDNISRQLQELKNLFVPEASFERAEKIKHEAATGDFTTDEEDRAIAQDLGLDLTPQQRKAEAMAVQAAWMNLDMANQQDHAALEQKHNYTPPPQAPVRELPSMDEIMAFGVEDMTPAQPQEVHGLHMDEKMPIPENVMSALAQRMVPRQSSGLLEVQSLEGWAPDGFPSPAQPQPQPQGRGNREAMDLLNNANASFFGG